MERRLAILAGASRQVIARCALAASLVVAPIASAAPKGKVARAEFDLGVALYKKQDYEAARAALERSAKLETDVETLFAWAQTERQLGNCEKAIELYEQLLDMEMPAANKKAIRPKIDDCKAMIAARLPAEPPPPAPEPVPSPAPEPAPAPGVVEAPRDVAPPPRELPPRRASSLTHPVGLGLLGVGALGLAVGGYFLYDGRQADHDSKTATNYFEYVRLRDAADTQGTRGVIAASVGGAFVVAGIIWYATRASDTRDAPVTGWLVPGGGGLAARGRF